jgi:hypothetical protein
VDKVFARVFGTKIKENKLKKNSASGKTPVRSRNPRR